MRLNGRFTATTLGPALDGPGQERAVATAMTRALHRLLRSDH